MKMAGLLLFAAWGSIFAANMETNTTRAPLPSPEQIEKLPPDGGPGFNRLIHERSPYLLQHARNPVNWFPWGDDAFAKAKKENKPVFLSVGYSSCHWCHVMEHESFERDDVAEILNKYFVAIKVDREERPDIDDIYMTATQLMTGRGGWPNSVWLLPDGRPWYAGTYFPREDRSGQPGFKTILLRLADVWTNQHAVAEEQAAQLSEAIRQNSSLTNKPFAGPLEGIVSNCVSSLAETFDKRYGGFGGAPKFPPHSALELLIVADTRNPTSEPRAMLAGTLDAMMLGGIHDHIGGGFHRYSTDDHWFVPHFEKMLYDNAQLAKTYAEAFAITSNENYRATACDICDWVLRDMTGPEGGFYSALDADSVGVEGKFYVWSRDEIMKILGEADGDFFCRTYDIAAAGNYHEEATGESTGSNIPFLNSPITTNTEKLAACRAKLQDARTKRAWPALDDKRLTAWNGLMISGLAVAGRNINEPRYTKAAERCAKFLLATMWKNGRLLRSYRAGSAAIDGYLDDYACLANGLLDLADATGNSAWRTNAQKICDAMIEQFYDPENGGFFTTSAIHEKLITRQKDAFDQAAPSGNGIAAIVLLRLADGKNSFRELAAKTIRSNGDLLRRAPTGCATLVRALAMLQATEPKSAAVASAEIEPVRAELFLDGTKAAPGTVVAGHLALTIAEKFHINANPAADTNLIPTALSLAENWSAKLLPDSFPDGGAERIYKGRIEIPLRLKIEHAAKEEPAELTFTVKFQACDEGACYPPKSLQLRATIIVNR